MGIFARTTKTISPIASLWLQIASPNYIFKAFTLESLLSLSVFPRDVIFNEISYPISFFFYPGLTRWDVTAVFHLFLTPFFPVKEKKEYEWWRKNKAEERDIEKIGGERKWNVSALKNDGNLDVVRNMCTIRNSKPMWECYCKIRWGSWIRSARFTSAFVFV